MRVASVAVGWDSTRTREPADRIASIPCQHARLASPDARTNAPYGLDPVDVIDSPTALVYVEPRSKTPPLAFLAEVRLISSAELS